MCGGSKSCEGRGVCVEAVRAVKEEVCVWRQ